MGLRLALCEARSFGGTRHHLKSLRALVPPLGGNTRVGRAGRIHQFDADFVAQAKDFERAAKQDLEQYRTWLDHYAAADQKDRRKHERRLKREQARYRREVRVRYARRLAYRYGSAALRLVRATAASIWKTVAIGAVLLALLVLAIGKWIVVRVRDLALLLARSAQAASAWIRPRAYRLTVRSRRRTAHGLDWVALQTARMDAWAAVRRKKAAAFARAKGAQALTFSKAKGAQALAFSSATGSQALAFISAQAKAGARASSRAATSGYAWSAARAEDCARAIPPMMRATGRGALRTRRLTRAGALRFRDATALRLKLMRDIAWRAVATRGAALPQPPMKLLTFQPARGALIPVEPPRTALAVIEPAPWTGAAQSGINITAPESEPGDAATEPKRKPRAMKVRPRKPRRGPRRKRHQSPAAPGKPRPRGRKRPRVS